MRSRSIPRWAVAILLVVPAFGLGLAVSAAASPTTTTFYGCLHAGTLSSVSTTAPPKCGKFTPVSWSELGPQGPQGPAGATGQNGSSVTAALEAPGTNCASGGDRVTNSADGSVTYVCNGTNGSSGVAYDCAATPYPGIDLAECNLGGALLYGRDLTGVDFAGANLEAGDFIQSNFLGANLAGANLSNASLFAATNVSTADTTDVTWSNTQCPDGTNSDNNGFTCVGHF
jgi:hypothetical protein